MYVTFIYSRRLTGTRSFNRSDNAPWRRSFASTTQDSPSNASTNGKHIFKSIGFNNLVLLFIHNKENII